MLGHVYSKFALGKWDELLESLDEIPEDEFVRARAGFAQGYVAFGTAVRASTAVSWTRPPARLTPFSELEESADVQEEVEFACGAATLRLAEGDAKEALRFARVAIAGRSAMSVGHMSVKEAVVVGLEAASSLDDRDTLAELLEMIRSDPLGRRCSSIRRTWRGSRLDRPRGGRTRSSDSASPRSGRSGRSGSRSGWPSPSSSTGSGSMRLAGRQPRVPIVLEARSIFEDLGALAGSTGRVGSMKEPRFAPEWIGASGT